MRPIATDQDPLKFPLSELFSTPANVRLLRMMADGSAGPISVAQAATRCGLSLAGARRALKKLEGTGYVQQIGSGRAPSFALREGDPLVAGIRAVFECERERYQSLIAELKTALTPLTEIQAAWVAREDAPEMTLMHIGVLSDARSLAHLREQVRLRISEVEQNFDLTIEVRLLSRADMGEVRPEEMTLFLGYLKNVAPGFSGSHQAHDQRTHAMHLVIAKLIHKDPSIIVRARHYLKNLLTEDHGPAKHDSREWRNLLLHYSPQRIRQLLVSDSQRAQRLRQSSPFFAVLTQEQRQQVYASAERPSDA